jgi:Mlc titration factor MtfA (ptsG expression regulator)/RimJ/RimL family protein N-acetyltransferase
MPSYVKKDTFRRQLLAEPFPKEWEAWLSANLTHYGLLNSAERARLQDDAKIMIAEKTWEGCDGLKVTEIMKLTVAAQAALLLLGLDHDYFSRVQSIVLFPTAFEMPAESWEERGSFALGRAVDYGTVFLSWETVLAEARDPASGHNLVIHEFTHQLDFLDGYTNGAPPLRSRDLTQRWQRVMQGTFQRLRRSLQQGQKTFLGSYAATNPTEFFSVASEKFFTLPRELRQNHPELFDVLAEYYRVDPLAWFQEKRGVELSSAPSGDAEGAVAAEPETTAREPAPESDFIDFACPYCGRPVSFPPPDAGTLKECPNCLESMNVPDRPGQPAERIPFPIRTDRLVLRHFQTLDAKELAQIMSDSANLRYLDWNPMSLEDAEEWIAGQSRASFPKSDDYCCFAIESTEAARVIGMVTFWFQSDESNLAQFEIIVHPGWQRKGYATEAVQGLLAYAFTGLRARRIVADCDARNLPARRLLLKVGLRQESECIQDRLLKGEWVSTLGFALLKAEYDTRNSPVH